MKKIVALLMLLCIAVMPVAMAETASCTWEEVGAPTVEQNGLEGDFVALPDLGLVIWIPADMQAVEPSEEDVAAGRYALFMDNDQQCALTIDAINVEGMTLDQAYQNAVDSGMTDPEIVNVNGLDTLSYSTEALNSGTILLVDTNSNMIIFTFTPFDSDVAKTAFTIISSSIMPEA